MSQVLLSGPAELVLGEKDRYHVQLEAPCGKGETPQGLAFPSQNLPGPDGMETPTLDTVGYMDASHTQHQQVHAAPTLSPAQVVL